MARRRRDAPPPEDSDPIAEAEARTAARLADLEARASEERRLARPEDYVYDKSQEQYWDLRDGTLNGERAVDASIPIELWRVEEPPARAAAPGPGRPARPRIIKPSVDICRVENNQFVEGSTWWPGQEQVIKDWFIDANGAYKSKGRRIYNQYRPPPLPPAGAEAKDARPWLDHIEKLWPEEDERKYFLDYCAHMIQRPDQKANAAIILSGKQGIGKDLALTPVRIAAGPWNSKNISPDDLFSQYRPWLQTLMLIVDETRPSQDEFHASSLYNILKPMIVTPPDTLPMNDKYVRLRHIINVLRVFITTNNWLEMYVPPDDRRYFILHSNLQKNWHIEEDKPAYFVEMFDWVYEGGGWEAVSAYLRERKIAWFEPKSPPPRTSAWESVAESWGEPDDAVAKALDGLGRPRVLFGAELLAGEFDYKDEIMGMLRSPRKLAHRMASAGYTSISLPKDAVARGERKWTFASEGGKFKSSSAFVKPEVLAEGRGKATEELLIRGKTLANQARGPKIDPR